MYKTVRTQDLVCGDEIIGHGTITDIHVNYGNGLVNIWTEDSIGTCRILSEIDKKVSVVRPDPAPIMEFL
jgi:hypothetical protein